MSPIPAVLVGVLFAVGTYLILQRTLTRIILGFAVLAHAVNLLILAAGTSGVAPIVGDSDATMSDPLPQAFVLTAIVIAFAISTFLLTLAYRSWQLTHNDEVADDIEDRRIAGKSTPSGDADPGDAEAGELL